VSADGAYLLGRRRTILVFFGTMLGMSLTGLTLGMLAPTLPHVVAELGGVEYFSWIWTGYLVVTAATIPLWGKLADMYGRRSTYTSSLALFGLGAVVCGFAPSMPVLLGGRALMGLGAGGMVPIAMAITADLMAPRERGKWQGVSGVVFGGSTLLAPALGGWISDTFGWRWTFFALVPFCLVAAAVAWFGVTYDHPKVAQRLDYGGAALVVAAVGSLLLAVTWGGDRYAWTSAPVIALVAAALAFTAVFVWWESRVANPIVPLSLYRNRTFTAAQFGLLGTHSVLFVATMESPLILQGVLGVSASAAGSLMIPYSAGILVSGLVAGTIVTRTGHYRPVLLASPLILAFGCYRLTQLDLASTPAEAAMLLAVLGVGNGLTAGTLVVVVQNAVPDRAQGVASAGIAFTRIISGAVAIAVVGALLSMRVGHELARRAAGTAFSASSLRSIVEKGSADAHAVVVREAFAAAAPGVYWFLLPPLAVAFSAMFFIERRELRRTVHDDVPEVEPTPRPTAAPSALPAEAS
jgi:EmrB/QacA subfamily drug resistance transporter